MNIKEKLADPKNIVIVFLSCFLIIFSFIYIKEYRKKISKIPIAQAYNNCIDQPKELYDKGLCLKDLADYVDKNYSVAEIEVAIKTITDNQKLQWCHEFMHYVGWGLYDKTQNLFDAFLLASSSCDSGMYHGIVEQYINQAKLHYDPTGFIAAVKSACVQGVADRGLPQAMRGHCYHGLGHGFMFISDNELNQSLRLCDNLEGGLANSCYSGALMENVQSKQVGREASHPSKYSFDTSLPDYPCNILDGKYVDFCYRYKGISNVVLTAGDFKKSFQLCLAVKPEYQEECFFGVGDDIPGPFWSSATAAQKCDLALEVDPRAYPQCIKGAMLFLMQINVGNPQAAVEYCDVIAAAYKDVCYSTSGTNFRDWLSPGETLEKKCSAFGNPHAEEICLKADRS